MYIKDTEIDQLMAEHDWWTLKAKCSYCDLDYDSLIERMLKAKILDNFYLAVNTDKYIFRENELLSLVPVVMYNLPENQIVLSSERVIGLVVSGKMDEIFKDPKRFALTIFDTDAGKSRLYIKDNAFWNFLYEKGILTDREEQILRNFQYVNNTPYI